MTEEEIKRRLIGICDAWPINDRHERHALWERCWSASLRAEMPDYFSGSEEYARFVQLRTELYTKHLDGIAELSEFGCGVGHNLSPLIASGKKLRGFDWSPAAVKRCKERGIEAEVFDMFNPSADVTLHGAVLTIHALEQLGSNWRAFLEFLLVRKAQLCIHIEPIEELYDETALHDFLCLAYHRKRGYLSGFLTGLRELEKWGGVEIIEVRKSAFGNDHHDAYSVVIWRAK